jgi:hypothetical protein
MTQRNRGLLFAVAGAVLLIVGAIGILSARSDDSSEPATASPASTPQPSPVPDSTPAEVPAVTTDATAVPTTLAPTATTASPTTTSLPVTTTTVESTTTTIALEDPATFVQALIEAQAAADIEFLLVRLHPAVLDKYGGIAPCQTYLAGVTFPAITLREILPPEAWEYATDDIVVPFANAIGVEVERIVDGQTFIQELHVAYSGAELRWFTDCGAPA